MMNTSDSSSISASQTMNVSSKSQPLLAAALPTFPLPGSRVTSFNYAIAMEQYKFQRSLVNQQVLAQQQAVAYFVSIQTAAERAAEISKLLLVDRKDLPMEKPEKLSPKREEANSKSHSTSPPQLKYQSSRSKSVSPVRYRNGHREHDKQSPTAHRSYRTDRHSSYYSRYGDCWAYSRSSHRRDGHFGSRSYHGSGTNIGRSRRRSPFLRYRHDDSHPPRHHRSRSPLPKFKPKHSARVTRRRSLSRSPLHSSSPGSSPQHTKIRSPRKSISTNLSPTEYRQSRTTTSLLKDNRIDDVNCRAENNCAADLDVKHRETEARPFREKLIAHASSNSCRSGSTSSECSGPINHKEPSVNKLVSGRLRSAREDCSSSLRSHDQSTQRALRNRCDKRNSATLVPPRSTKDVDHSMQLLDRHQTMKDREISNRHTDHLKSPSENRHCSPDGSLPTRRSYKCNETKDDMDDPKYIANASHKTSKQTEMSLWSSRPQHEQNVIGSNQRSASFSDVETDERMLKNECEDCLDGIKTVDGVNNNVTSIKGGISGNDDLGVYGHPNLHSDCAIYPLPEADKSTVGKEIGCNLPWPEEVVHISDEKVPVSPVGCQYETYKHRSLPLGKKRKHGMKHHKKHRRNSEVEIDCKKAKCNKRKRKRPESKSYRRHHKKESKSRKRRHRDMSSSSSFD
ncbi:hypothetical protein FRX31_023642 [Thalictrum thalictroides]|uniref:Uncharacterized protein n=1 Tax=Thalictrum thalictroides TaxID=46969 RepID=A0A7J6VNS8_THATH|nr:hypothetical protein FRX31_023642 [Thalictrum thalictroides]